eukprot:14259407-Alexandrium_andersonii.AAC.1
MAGPAAPGAAARLLGRAAATAEAGVLRRRLPAIKLHHAPRSAGDQGAGRATTCNPATGAR